jgi:hypothetical protein
MASGPSSKVAARARALLAARSSNRIQIQIPLGESLITFLHCSAPNATATVMGALVDLILFDARHNRSHIFHMTEDALGKGLVKLPSPLQFPSTWSRADQDALAAGRPVRAELHTNLARALAGDMSAQSLLHSDLATLVDKAQKTLDLSALPDGEWQLEWICPAVPEGSVVLWHGWHTTRSSDTTAVKTAIFFDYAEASVLHALEGGLSEYAKLNSDNAYTDVGSGNSATRSAAFTREYCAHRNLPSIAPHSLIGPHSADGLAGDLRASVEANGFLVVPLNKLCTGDEMDEVRTLVNATALEAGDYITYVLFEREVFFLTAWLRRFAPDDDPYLHLALEEAWTWLLGLAGKPLFGPEGVPGLPSTPLKRLLDFALYFEPLEGGRPAYCLRERKETHDEALWLDDKTSAQTPAAKDEEAWYCAHLHEWGRLVHFGALLDVRAPAADPPPKKGEWEWNPQILLWDEVLPFLRKNQRAETPLLGHPLLAYRRHGLGHPEPGQSLADWLEATLRATDSPYDFYHESVAQSGGRLIANDSGMGPASSLYGGTAHLALQTHPAMWRIAVALYGPHPALVPERLRFKVAAPWGKVHVDHAPLAGRRSRDDDDDDHRVGPAPKRLCKCGAGEAI